jgi:hypothetical protein
MAERDERGRFLPGNKVAVGNGGGRPSQDDIEKLTSSLSKVISNGTLDRWAAAMKRKLERADPWATDFTFNRLLGKVPDKQELGGVDGGALEIVIRHVEVPYPDHTGETPGAASGS